MSVSPKKYFDWIPQNGLSQNAQLINDVFIVSVQRFIIFVKIMEINNLT